MRLSIIFAMLGLIALLSAPVAQAQYLTEDFESAFSGDPAAPTGWTQSRVVLLGDGLPDPISTNGEKDWERNEWTGSAWTLVPSSAGTQPTGAQSGSGVLWMNDYWFGSTTSAGFGSRRLASPTMNLSASTSPYVRFYLFCAYGADRLLLRVEASSDGGTTWNTIMFIPPNAGINGTMAVSTPWERVNVLIPPAYRTANAKIAIAMTNTWGTQNIWIDNLTVAEFTPTTVTSAATGNWADAGTWTGSVLPTSDNHVVISSGHTVTANVNMGRAQNLTIDGTLNYGTSTTQLIHAAGNVTVNPGGMLDAFNGTSGRKVYVGGNFVNNGTADFSKAGANIVWLGGTAATFSASGTFTNGYLRDSWHANSAGVTYNSAATFVGTIGLYTGTVNPNGNLTLGDAGVTATQTLDRGIGSFTSAPIFAAGVTRSMTYSQPHSASGICLARANTVINPGFEIEDISGTRTVTGTFTMNTHNRLELTFPITIGTGASGGMTLTRGIIVTTPSNLLTVSSFVAGASGVAPSILTPPTTNGSYISGPLRIDMPSSGTTTRNFALGVGSGYNGATPNSNVLKTVNILPGATGWGSQTLTVSIGAAPTGGVNGPLTGLMGLGTYRVDLNGGPDLPATATMTVRGRNTSFGNSDNMVGTQGDLRVAQAPAASGTWTERSATSGGTAAFAVDTDYSRTTTATIAPLASNGEYFALATVASNMVYDSSTTTQTNVAGVGPGSTNQEIIAVRVYTTGGLSPLSLTQLNLSTNGTTNAADISKAKVFFTGTSSTFATTTQFGSDVNSPSGAFNVTGSATLGTGTNYFWVAYDIAPGAPTGNVVDAECSQITVASIARIPTVTAPAGSRPIQLVVTIGAGTSTDRKPLGTWYGYERSAALYLGTEFGVTGVINSLSWYVQTLLTGAVNGPTKIYLKTTSATTHTADTWANMIAGADLVYDNTPPALTAGGWNSIAIAPWQFPSTSNNFLVLVETNYGGTGGDPTSTTKAIRYTSQTSRHMTWNTDNSPPTGNGTVGSFLPNIQIEYSPLSAMTYTSSTTTQNVTTAVPQGATNQRIIGVQVVTNGALSPLSATQFNLNTNGSTNPGTDIANAKVYYTGTSSTFATTTLFGTTASPSGAFSVSGSQVLAPGTNYFWVTYDIQGTATLNNVVDAECASIVVAAITRIPTVTAPAGSRQIKAPLAGTKTVGTAGDYASMTDALSEIGVLGLSGNLNLDIISNLSFEMDPPDTALVINQWSEVGAGGYTLTIRPSGGPRTIAGNSATATIKINGADRVTIDGRIAGSGRNLTITNASASTASGVIWVSNPSAADSANNITIRNCNIHGSSSSAQIVALAVSGSGVGTVPLSSPTNVTIQDNYISKAQNGIYFSGVSATRLGTGNQITDNTIGTASAGDGFVVRAVHTNFQDGMLISNNDIQNVTGTAGTMQGMLVLEHKNAVVRRNRVHGISYSGTSTTKVYGIIQSATTNATSGSPSMNLYVNNAVYDIVNSATSSIWNTSGINIEGGYGDRFYFNTVYLSGQMNTTGTGPSAAFSNGNANISANSDAIEVVNNIFQIAGSSTTGASKMYAHYTTNADYATPASVLNYNDLYATATGGSATAVLGRINAVDHATLGAWQSASGEGVNTIAADAMLNAPPSGPAPQAGSPVLGAGQHQPSITTIDILGTSRANPPTIGAYETSGDFSGPAVSYTALNSPITTTNRTFTANITDASGVATGGNAPRVYYRKGTSGAYVSTATTGNVGADYSFTIDYSLVGGVTAGDVIQYYVAAQDLAGTPNVTTNPSGGSGINPPGTTAPSAPNSYFIRLVVSSFPYTEDFEDPSPDVVVPLPGFPVMTADASWLAEKQAEMPTEAREIEIAVEATAELLGAQTEFASKGKVTEAPRFVESGGLGWLTSSVSGGVNEWVRGTPAKPRLNSAHSGTKAYITGTTANYSINHNAAVLSPVFNFTSLAADPKLEFWHIFVTERNWDGGVLERSVDGGTTWSRVDSVLGTGPTFNTANSTGWYNNSSTSGPLAPPKWSDSSNTYAGHAGGWIKSTTTLTGTAGLPDVRLRWRFQSDPSINQEGWAIDDVSILPQSVVVSVPVGVAWNLIANPVTTSQDSVKQLYPTSTFNYAFSFGTGGYTQSFRLLNGKGYWGKFPGSTVVDITGAPRTSEVIPVVSGWNLVGSISFPVDTATITSTPTGIRASDWFGYSGAYSASPQIVPGKAYWVKSSQAGSFTLVSSAPASRPASESPLASLSTLTITDAHGATQTLYFGAEGSADVTTSWYDMPPVPPAGAFDARFESETGGRMVELVSADLGVAIQSVAYPLTVSWNIKGSGSFDLADGSGAGVFASKTMAGEGSLVIASPSVNRLVIMNAGGAEGLPKEFALMQNYPNPFNPTTNIKFALPVESRVTVEIYNALGQKVRTLVNEDRKAGYHVAEWNGAGNGGQQLASGVYFARFNASGADGRSFSDIRKLMMVK